MQEHEQTNKTVFKEPADLKEKKKTDQLRNTVVLLMPMYPTLYSVKLAALINSSTLIVMQPGY